MKFFFSLLFFLCLCSQACADTVYLKNGNSFDGVVEREDNDAVEVRLDYGTMVFKRGEISHVDKVSDEKNQELWDAWSKKKELDAAKAPEDKIRRKASMDEAARLRQQHAEKRRLKEDEANAEIPLTASNGHLILQAVLNGRVHVKLILDSGANTVALYKHVADELGLEVEKMQKSRSGMADGSIADTYSFTLDSVRVLAGAAQGLPNDAQPGIEAKSIAASVFATNGSLMPGDTKADGVLGTSFLKNFRFNVDYERKTLSLQRIGEGR